MIRCALAALLALLLSTSFSRADDSSSWPPGPKCAFDLNSLMTPDVYPSGDQHNSYVVQWSYAHHCWRVGPIGFLSGPGNLPDVPSTCGGVHGGICLAANTWTYLDDVVGSGGNPGSRAGAQYPPFGKYHYDGVYTFIPAVANSMVEMQITVGNAPGIGAQSNFLVGTPSYVGGGANNCATAGAVCQVTVFSGGFGCYADYPPFGGHAGGGQACEIRIMARINGGAGKAVQATPNLTANVASSNRVTRAGPLGSDQ